ncbi:hypothetical protein ASC97_23555 [Rhizobium sp. Root1203]|uniref:RHS repeat domain-containing protein n=1 Tax=Rhizobium sp. Root1203 TaxID=1736427 RepID=UPI00070AA59F|nr:RHS repeat domain-containing protein [Rhizobium sp. Root1203]KQV29315.1 hypothetical protein ASC97_23555 [Rhizobium sp. Root1203]
MSLRTWLTGAGIVIATATLFGWTLPASADNFVTYGYDPDGRLVSALYDNGLCVVYVYDANGNRTAQTDVASATPPTWGSASWGCVKWTSP